ncbi:hypothetical protein FRC19_009338 [Serendipita sp. 401]|nr:hypothetical protein FRC19_009338 [Serendipita sp. 401]KAG8830470.1 hypothetical protein FRC20_008421 [Serendipita sp. 405]KAG9057149.1 hypothetical protein FS842_008441 [Serendipita sp. 407]
MYFARSLLHECRPLFRVLEDNHSHLLRRSNWPYPAVSTTLKSDGPLHHFWSWRGSGWNGRSFDDKSMSLDMVDKGDTFSIEADLPGVKKENLNVRIGDNGRSLVIEGSIGKKSDEQKAQTSTDQSSVTEHSLLSERTAKFFRKIWLPQPIEASAVKAKLEDGVLKLHIPKAKEDGSLRVDVA